MVIKKEDGKAVAIAIAEEIRRYEDKEKADQVMTSLVNKTDAMMSAGYAGLIKKLGREASLQTIIRIASQATAMHMRMLEEGYPEGMNCGIGEYTQDMILKTLEWMKAGGRLE